MYKKFSVYQEILVFYYSKKSKMVPQNGENAYLATKNPRASRAPKVGSGPRPIRAHFICTTLLSGVGKNRQKILEKGPKFLVWPPALYEKLATALVWLMLILRRYKLLIQKNCRVLVLSENWCIDSRWVNGSDI